MSQPVTFATPRYLILLTSGMANGKGIVSRKVHGKGVTWLFVDPIAANTYSFESQLGAGNPSM